MATAGNYMARQFVAGDTMPAGVLIDGTFSVVVQASEANTAANFSLQAVIRVVSSDGTVERAVLYAGHAAANNSTSGALGQEFTALATRIMASQTISSYTTQSGDRLVVEIGVRADNASTTAYDPTFRFGDPVTGSDATLVSGTTSTTIVPWIELSADLFPPVSVALDVASVTAVAYDAAPSIAASTTLDRATVTAVARDISREAVVEATVTNRMLDPSFEVLGNGVAIGSNAGLQYPIAFDTGTFRSGARSASTTRTSNTPTNVASSVYLGAFSAGGSGKLSATPGERLSFSMWVRCDRAGYTAGVQITYRSAASATIGLSGYGSFSTLAANTWTLVKVENALVPANTNYVFISPIVQTVGGANADTGTQVWFDDAILNTGTTVLPYFSGATTDTALYDYQWTGTANQSTSVRIPAVTVSLDVAPVTFTPRDIVGSLGVQYALDATTVQLVAYDVSDTGGDDPVTVQPLDVATVLLVAYDVVGDIPPDVEYLHTAHVTLTASYVAPDPATGDQVEAPPQRATTPYVHVYPSGIPGEYATTVGTYGVLRVRAGDANITTLRGAPVIVNGWGSLDPGGHDAATLDFPMLKLADLGSLGQGDLAWYFPGVTVRIDVVPGPGAPQNDLDNVWRGRVRAVNVRDGRVSMECDGDLIGPMSWATYRPTIERKVQDVGHQIYNQIPIASHVRVEETITGIEVERTGSRADSRMGWMLNLLALAQTRGGDQWTVLPKTGNGNAGTYEIVKRDLTSHDLTIHLGVPGVEADLLYDITSRPTRYYGEGQRPDGGRWYGAVFPYLAFGDPPEFPGVMQYGDTNEDTTTGDGIMVLYRTLGRYGMSADDVSDRFGRAMESAVEDAQDKAGLPVTGIVNQATWTSLFTPNQEGSLYGAHYETLAERRDVRPLDRLSSGLIVGKNPYFDGETPVVDSFVGFGVGVTKSYAREWCREQMRQDFDNPEWSGTITLTTDPLEMSRFSIRAGMNFYDPDFTDDGGVFHIASVTVDWQSGSVSCAVSTRGRDYMDLASIIERNKLARSNPSKRFAANFSRRSALSQDMRAGWDYEGGAGIIPETKCKAHQWTVIPVFVGESGSVGELHLRTRDQETEFATAIFARQIKAEFLNRIAQNPLAHRNNDGSWVSDNAKELHGTGKTDGNGNDSDPQGDEKAQLAINGRLTEGRLLVYAAGTGTTETDAPMPCGYWPHENAGKNDNDSLGSNLTGRWKDDAGFDYWTYQTPFLYVAVWTRHATTIEGRLYASMLDGGA
jgi:hypothetical protein